MPLAFVKAAFADGTLNPRIDHLSENSAKLISGEIAITVTEISIAQREHSKASRRQGGDRRGIMIEVQRQHRASGCPGLSPFVGIWYTLEYYASFGGLTFGLSDSQDQRELELTARWF
jgi:hypothetical protein